MRLFFTFIYLIICLAAISQNVTTQGKEFYVTFIRNLVTEKSEYETSVFITSTKNTSGTIANPNTGFRQAFISEKVSVGRTGQ